MLARLPRDAELARALAEDPRLRGRLVAVLGASAALGDHLARHPGHWRVLAGADDLPAPAAEQVRAELLAAVGARPGDPEPVAGVTGGSAAAAGAAAGETDGRGAPGPVAALRVATGGGCSQLAARDLTGGAPSTRSPPSWPTSPPRRSRRPWRSPAPSCRPARRRAGWR